ncbi:hypothetical protein [Oxalicibacterium faecigallinarum]|uniref:hypothetical protein n=1 Tax=Oxalicibacterium faecigallinarum TaxID=573741 RepID=UPI001E65812E|nr:hypothetical protein [Oxalicibacterium faecigallinarum]
MQAIKKSLTFFANKSRFFHILDQSIDHPLFPLCVIGVASSRQNTLFAYKKHLHGSKNRTTISVA